MLNRNINSILAGYGVLPIVHPYGYMHQTHDFVFTVSYTRGIPSDRKVIVTVRKFANFYPCLGTLLTVVPGIVDANDTSRSLTPQVL
jgi:hypothetical protein